MTKVEIETVEELVSSNKAIKAFHTYLQDRLHVAFPSQAEADFRSRVSKWLQCETQRMGIQVQ